MSLYGEITPKGRETPKNPELGFDWPARVDIAMLARYRPTSRRCGTFNLGNSGRCSCYWLRDQSSLKCCACLGEVTKFGKPGVVDELRLRSARAQRTEVGISSNSPSCDEGTLRRHRPVVVLTVATAVAEAVLLAVSEGHTWCRHFRNLATRLRGLNRYAVPNVP